MELCEDAYQFLMRAKADSWRFGKDVPEGEECLRMLRDLRNGPAPEMKLLNKYTRESIVQVADANFQDLTKTVRTPDCLPDRFEREESLHLRFYEDKFRIDTDGSLCLKKFGSVRTNMVPPPSAPIAVSVFKDERGEWSAAVTSIMTSKEMGMLNLRI